MQHNVYIQIGFSAVITLLAIAWVFVFERALEYFRRDHGTGFRAVVSWIGAILMMLVMIVAYAYLLGMLLYLIVNSIHLLVG